MVSYYSALKKWLEDCHAVTYRVSRESGPKLVVKRRVCVYISSEKEGVNTPPFTPYP